jgi:hypothetical protein
MPIPESESVFRPLLDLLSDGKDHPMEETLDQLASHFQLSAHERKRLLPNVHKGVFKQRVAWAKAWLNMARLTEKGGRKITPAGQTFLRTAPDYIDRSLLINKFGWIGRKGKDGVDAPPKAAGGAGPPSFQFRKGCSMKKDSTVALRARQQKEMILRHNKLQDALYGHLCKKHGPQNVGTECPGPHSTKVDVAVRQNNKYWFYEIKIADSARACIREAVGQLLEYAFWPGSPAVDRLIVVGEPEIDRSGKEYLCRLKERFSLQIEYQHFSP